MMMLPKFCIYSSKIPLGVRLKNVFPYSHLHTDNWNRIYKKNIFIYVFLYIYLYVLPPYQTQNRAGQKVTSGEL